MYLFPDINYNPVFTGLPFSPLIHFSFSSSLLLVPPSSSWSSFLLLCFSGTLLFTSVLIASSLFCISHRLSASSSWQRSTGLFLEVSLPIFLPSFCTVVNAHSMILLFSKSPFIAPSHTGRVMCPAAALLLSSIAEKQSI